jgi:tight adherence protein C
VAFHSGGYWFNVSGYYPEFPREKKKVFDSQNSSGNHRFIGLCVARGLDFMAAVRWVVDKVKPNPMIEELVLVLKEINVGKPRVEALRDMAKRLDIPDVTSFVRTLIQADRMGTPVEEAFRILSEDSRMRRFHRGERQAMKAPLKMLIPLIFCILPVILIIVAGPILIRFIKEGLFAGM